MNVLRIGASGTIGKAVYHLLNEQAHTLISATRSTQSGVEFTRLTSIDAFYEQTDELDAILIDGAEAAFSQLDQLTDAQPELTLSSNLMSQIKVIQPRTARIVMRNLVILVWPTTQSKDNGLTRGLRRI